MLLTTSRYDYAWKTHEKNRTICIKAIGVSEIDRNLLKDLIDLAPINSSYAWKFVEDQKADIVLVDVDSSAGQHFYQTAPDCRLITTGGEPIGPFPHLPKPLRNKLLMQTLMHLTDEMLLADEQAVTEEARVIPASVPTSATEVTDDFLEVLGRLAEGEERRQTFVSADGEPIILLRPGKAWVKGGIGGLKGLEAGVHQRVDIERAETRQIAVFRIDSEEVPIRYVISYLGMQYSNGRLLPKLADWPAFRLTQWPDLSDDLFCREYARMGRFLMSHSATIAQLARRGGVSEQEAIGFLNIGFLNGWLDRSESPTQSDVEPPRAAGSTGHSPFLGKLRKSIGI